MQIRFHCPNETCVAIIEFEPLEEAGDSIECPRCHTRHKIEATQSVNQAGLLERCPLCSCSEMFVRKDFPQAFGVALVILAGAISFATLKSNSTIAYGVLLLAMFVDFVLYMVVGKMTACYACRAEFREAELNPEHEGFDLATSEKY